MTHPGVLVGGWGLSDRLGLYRKVMREERGEGGGGQRVGLYRKIIGEEGEVGGSRLS